MRTRESKVRSPLHKRLQVRVRTITSKENFIGAIGTPLGREEQLHREGLERLLEMQWSSHLDGILVGGTMGVMQLLRDDTYRALVEESISISKGRGEVLVGCGDTSLTRTVEKITFLNNCKPDGVVVLSPYFLRFSQDELYSYYDSLANLSVHPLYIYEIPSRTGVSLEHATIERLAENENILGIKCSCEWGWTEKLIDRLGDRLRVIVVQLEQIDSLLQRGVMGHLDGIFALVPSVTNRLKQAAEVGKWEEVAECRMHLVHLRNLLRSFGSFQAATVLWNAQGVPGNFAPAPLRQLTELESQQLLEDPIFLKLGLRLNYVVRTLNTF